MTFAERYLSFDVRINDLDRNISTRYFTKTPLHPEGDVVEIFTRVIAHVIRFEEGLELSAGMFDPNLPSSFKKDIYDKYQTIILFNERDADRVEKLLRHNKHAVLSLFYSSPEALSTYLHTLRSHLTSPMKSVECISLVLPELLIQKVVSGVARFRFDILITEGSAYVEMDHESVSFEIRQLNLADEYQKSIQQ